MNEPYDVDLSKRLTLVTLAAGLSGCGGGGGGSTSSGSGSGGGTTPAPAPTASTVKAAVAGNNLTLAIKSTGAAYVWGENNWGQTGNGNLISPQTSALPVAGNTTWKVVAAGGFHTLGIKSDGTLWAWGFNLNGQLGDGTSGSSSGQAKYRPTPVQIGTGKDWVTVSAGDSHSIGIKGTTPVMMSWGQNTSGQLGLGTTTSGVPNTTDVNVPTAVTYALLITGLAKLPYTDPQTKTTPVWVSVSCGAAYTIGLWSDGRVFTWGDNSSGQLGQTVVQNPSVPTVITLPATPKALSIAAGAAHALVISSDRRLVAWGSNERGQLGNGLSGTANNLPYPGSVGGGDEWVAVAAGGAHSLGIKYPDQTLWAWGSNSDGQLGDGTTTDSVSPKQIGTSRWVAVAAGKSHSMAIATDGTLWAWGRNAEGQLGNGSTTGLLVPTQIP